MPQIWKSIRQQLKVWTSTRSFPVPVSASSVCHKSDSSSFCWIAFSGVLNATWQVTDALRGWAVLGPLSHLNEWPSENTIKFQACTLSQEGNFQKLRLRILGASFVLSWECFLGDSRIRGQSTDFWTSEWDNLRAGPTLSLPNCDSEKGA